MIEPGQHLPSEVIEELQEVLAHYDLGELAAMEKNERGFVNTAFAIETTAGGQRHRYFLRKYKRGIREEELQFEHSLIEHLEAAGDLPSAHVYRTRSGETYLKRFEGAGDTEGIFYAIFDFLAGEDRYTWVDPVLSDAELAASAVVLARFHNAVSSLAPRGRRAEPKIGALLPVIAETWAASPGKSKRTVFDECLQADFERVAENIRLTRARLEEPGARNLPEIVIHCDYHPGNLKFSGDQISALFDFDWSKVDLRAFDLGLALWYFCASWQGAQDGQLRLNWLKIFLEAYQEHLRAYPGIGPLSPSEVEYLPVLINAGNLYVLNWTVLDFYSKDVDPQEYLAFLQHSLNFTRWFEIPANRAELETIVAQAVAA